MAKAGFQYCCNHGLKAVVTDIGWRLRAYCHSFATLHALNFQLSIVHCHRIITNLRKNVLPCRAGVQDGQIPWVKTYGYA